MQTFTSASYPPCCGGRLANTWSWFLTLAIACVGLWPSTANSQLVPTESEFQFAGPAGRNQQRLASEFRILGDTSQFHWEPMIQLCAQWRDRLGDLRVVLEEQHRLAMQQQKPSKPAEEEIGMGQPETDPCFIGAPLSSVRVSIATPPGAQPEDLAAVCRASAPPISDTRMTCGWAIYEKQWAASGSHHRPLYFEEINAERYGYTPCECMQPFISAGRFLITVPALPYLIAARAPRDCIYTLGHYRPGDCVPYRWHHPPRCVIAGVYEAAIIVGLVALVP